MAGTGRQGAGRGKRWAGALALAAAMGGMALFFTGCGALSAMSGEAESMVGLKEETVDQEEVYESEAPDQTVLDFRKRFYAQNPDSLEILDIDAAREAVKKGEGRFGLLLAEFPDQDVEIYGYMDEKLPFQGVMVKRGDNVSYFPDIVYLSDTFRLPDFYEEQENGLFLASIHGGTGQERGKDTLYAFWISDNGSGASYVFDREDYLGQVENRFTLSYQEGEDTGTLVGQDGEPICQVDLSWAEGARITGLDVTDRVRFLPGSSTSMEIEVGFLTEGSSKAYYGSHVTVTAPVNLVVRDFSGGDRNVDFLVGDVVQKTDYPVRAEGADVPGSLASGRKLSDEN